MISKLIPGLPSLTRQSPVCVIRCLGRQSHKDDKSSVYTRRGSKWTSGGGLQEASHFGADEGTTSLPTHREEKQPRAAQTGGPWTGPHPACRVWTTREGDGTWTQSQEALSTTPQARRVYGRRGRWLRSTCDSQTPHVPSRHSKMDRNRLTRN